MNARSFLSFRTRINKQPSIHSYVVAIANFCVTKFVEFPINLFLSMSDSTTEEINSFIVFSGFEVVEASHANGASSKPVPIKLFSFHADKSLGFKKLWSIQFGSSNNMKQY